MLLSATCSSLHLLVKEEAWNKLCPSLGIIFIINILGQVYGGGGRLRDKNESWKRTLKMQIWLREINRVSLLIKSISILDIFFDSSETKLGPRDEY